MKTWICQYTCIAYKTLLVEAETRKEASEKLRSLECIGEGIDVNYGPIKSAKVIREDRKESVK